jgi:hypothetical protein
MTSIGLYVSEEFAVSGLFLFTLEYYINESLNLVQLPNLKSRVVLFKFCLFYHRDALKKNYLTLKLQLNLI